MKLLSLEPESSASANSATSAYLIYSAAANSATSAFARIILYHYFAKCQGKICLFSIKKIRRKFAPDLFFQFTNCSSSFFLNLEMKIARKRSDAIAIQILLIPIEIPAASAPISLWNVCKYHKTGMRNTKTLLILSTIVSFVCPNP